MAKPTIEDLRESARGAVITADDPDYDEARKVYNGMIDRRPRVVVRCVDAGDVMACVDFARENGLDLSVRGGGHSVPGFGTNDDGVVIDLSLMKGIRVDPHTQTVRAEGGCTWGDFNHATYPFGLATTGGVVSTTGIAGLTLGGGIGHLSRGLGLSIDNLLSADVVTADGQLLVASSKENEDLFWALRGGGGNFGVVTSFEYQLHPVKDIFAGLFFYPIERTRDVLEFYREYIADGAGADGCVPRVPNRTTAAVHPGEGARQDVHRDGFGLGRRPRPGREAARADPQCCAEGRGDDLPDAVSGDQRSVRPAAASGSAALLEGGVRV